MTVPVGTPLGPPRVCPACRQMHPVGTTCAGGLWPWKGQKKEEAAKEEALYDGGAERYRYARAHGIEDKAVALPGEPEWVDQTAAKAEDWVRKKLGLPRQGGIEVVRGPVDHEIVLPNGKRLDVKWSPRLDGRLIERIHRDKHGRTVVPDKADFYVLVVGRGEDEFRCPGWATADELHRSVIELGHGPVYGLRQNQLRPFATLKELAT